MGIDIRTVHLEACINTINASLADGTSERYRVAQVGYGIEEAEKDALGT